MPERDPNLLFLAVPEFGQERDDQDGGDGELDRPGVRHGTVGQRGG